MTLTFDNGPTPAVTERVLDILDHAGLHCIFFVIGNRLDTEAGRNLMEQTHAAGHWIGNHTLTHSVALGDQPDARYAAHEIGETQHRIGALTRPEKLFRPYGNSGLIGPHLLSVAAKNYLLTERVTTVIWNSVPGDWKDPDGWIDTCLSQIEAQDWSVVVLHDIVKGCLPRLPELLRRLASLPVQFEQGLPEQVVLTRGGQTVNLDPGYVATPAQSLLE